MSYKACQKKKKVQDNHKYKLLHWEDNIVTKQQQKVIELCLFSHIPGQSRRRAVKHAKIQTHQQTCARWSTIPGTGNAMAAEVIANECGAICHSWMCGSATIRGRQNWNLTVLVLSMNTTETWLVLCKWLCTLCPLTTHVDTKQNKVRHRGNLCRWIRKVNDQNEHQLTKLNQSYYLKPTHLLSVHPHMLIFMF